MLFTLFILKMGRFQTFRDGALRSGNCGQGSGGKKAASQENSHRVSLAAQEAVEDRGGSSGSNTIRCAPASMQSSVPERSRGYREWVGMPFQVRTTHLGGLRTNSPSDIKAQETKKKKRKKK